MAKSDLTWWDTPAEQQLLIWPMVSAIARDANAVAKIGIIRNKADTILQTASSTPVVILWQKSDRSMLDLLQWAYAQKEVWKWSLVGENIQAVRDFVQKMLQEIQFPPRESIKSTPPSNDEQYKEAA